ncbi:MAG: 4'-phosphopantetheinyl transferase superfamily protein [Eubacteriales bacterium]|nr:4'-phosphopantetheinyl transferase superfamily protein [Eubacteriales bacterium]
MHIYICNWDKQKAGDESIRQFLKDYSVKKNLGLTGEEINQTPIVRGTHGKPYFKDLPQVHFSVSHSGRYFGCSFETFPIGFDLEDLGIKRLKIMAVAKRFFTRQEYEYVLTGGKKAFYEIWVRKEAYVKYLGKGIGFGLSRFEVMGKNGIVDRLDGVYLGGISICPHIKAAYAAPKAVTIEEIKIETEGERRLC